jgi:hypoxanthine phosphoribosyltransferase
MNKIEINEKSFEIFLNKIEISDRIESLGKQIDADFDEEIILLGVLNGSFVFMADLARSIKTPTICDFMKISSYSGMESSGKVNFSLGLSIDIRGKNVIIVEDIVDTGTSVDFLISYLTPLNPKRLAIATLLFKKEAFRFNYPLDYVGFEIPNKFVVGFGLDYDGLGRNLPEIYQLSTL